MDFSLYDPQIFDCLRRGRDPFSAEVWFHRTISRAFSEVARRYGCDVQLSADRLNEARLMWIAEADKFRVRGGGPADQFKQAGLLAYWLRRRIVIKHKEETGVPSPLPNEDFLHYGNEICSFMVGFRICLFFETARKSSSERLAELASIHLDPEFLRDVAVVFYEKNVSPHAVYMIYRSLFYEIRGDSRSNVVPFARTQ